MGNTLRKLRLLELTACALLGLCLVPSARAHMPLARSVSIAPDGRHVALRLPGFGMVLGGGAGGYRYACDALLQISRSGRPGEPDIGFAHRADGALWLGTQSGLRLVEPSGCPAPDFDSELADVPVAAVATDAGGDKLYLATAEVQPRVLMSEDGGSHFTQLAELPEGAVRQLLLDERQTRLLLVHAAPTSSAPGPTRLFLLDTQGGAVGSMPLQAEGLLHARDDLLLARVRNPATRRITVVGAPQAGGALEAVTEVQFFGGFAFSPDGVFFVGDEGGGVQRAAEATLHFAAYAPQAVACLAYRQGLWACTPGLPDQPALVKYVETPDGPRAEPRLALSQVDQRVQCGEPEAADPCGPAWLEWQWDVLSLATDPQSVPDAGPRFSAAGHHASDGSAAPAADGPAARGAGCQLAPPASHAPAAPALWLLWVWLRRRPFLQPPLWHTLEGMSKRAASPSCPVPDDPTLRDDSALMAQAQRGDAEAFALLYDRHAPTMLALCLRMRLSQSEAQDLLQDIFIEAWQSVRRFEPSRGTVRAWLTMRTRSRALDRLKGRQRAQRARDRLQADRAPQALGPAEHHLAVRRALGELDEDLRRVLQLTYFEGLTAREVSQRTQVPEGTVKSRLARGLRTLERLLGEAAGTRGGRT